MIQGTSAVDRPVASRFPRRLLVRGVLLALLLVGAALAYPALQRWMTAERSISLSRLRLATVERGDLQRDVAVQGRIVAAFHPTVFSPAEGTFSLQVRAGDVVAEGQALGRIDSPELRSRLEQERSTLLSLDSALERQRILARQTMLADRQAVDLAVVELEAAGRAMDRAERSRREGIVNEVEYEQAQDDRKRAELRLDHARQNAELQQETLEFEVRNSELQVQRQRLVVAELERQVDELVIRAPVAGLVSRVDVDDHDAVVPGLELATVVDLSAFEVEVQMPESYADEIGPGTPCVVRYGNDEYEATVKTVSPEVEGSQVQGIVTFGDVAPEGLRQNQRVSVRIILESRDDVLKVTRGPFLESTGGHQAFLVEGRAARAIPIRIGAVSVSEVEIVEGLAEGDQIIISDTARFDGAEHLYLRP